jgi:hypothetical protein
VVAILGVVVVGGSQTCLACTCVQSTDEEQFARADVVFVGRAVERHDPRPEGATFGSGDQIDWTFAVESVQKGRAYDRQHVISSESSTACGWEFEVGERYQVFADREEDGTLHTSICSGTRHMEQGEAAYVPTSPQPPPPPNRSPTVQASPTSTPTTTVTPTAAPETAEPIETSNSTPWAWLAAALAVVALGLAAAFTFRRRS